MWQHWYNITTDGYRTLPKQSQKIRLFSVLGECETRYRTLVFETVLGKTLCFVRSIMVPLTIFYTHILASYNRSVPESHRNKKTINDYVDQTQNRVHLLGLLEFRSAIRAFDDWESATTILKRRIGFRKWQSLGWQKGCWETMEEIREQESKFKIRLTTISRTLHRNRFTSLYGDHSMVSNNKLEKKLNYITTMVGHNRSLA